LCDKKTEIKTEIKKEPKANAKGSLRLVIEKGII